jgi:nitroreductase
MHVHQAIRTRRTIFQFKPEPVPVERLEAVLAYGVWAPNHHLTQPWRFTLLGEETRQTLAQRYGEIQTTKAPPDSDEALRQKLRAAGVAKFLSKPTIVAVSCIQHGDEQERREDYAATCCAMQNIQLAAWADGIGMQWTTGPITRELDTYRLLGIDPEQEYILGFLYVGFPDESPTRDRKPLTEVLRRTP